MSPLEVFERDMIRRGCAPATQALLLATARRFLASVQKPLAKLTLHDARSYLARRAQEVSAVTHQGECYRLRAFFKALGKGEFAQALAVRPVASPPKTILTEEEVVRLLRAASQDAASRGNNAVTRACRLRDRACLELAYGLGLRASELGAAQVGDLSLPDASLMVRRAKRGECRPLPLPPASIPHLLRYLREGRPVLAKQGAPNLLLTRFGTTLDRGDVRNLVRRVGRRAGVDAHPHMLRAALATHLARAGTPLRVVQLLLGHKRLQTTAIYIGVDRAELHQAVARLDLGESR